MKIFQFIIFFTIVLFIYFSVNFYIYIRGLQCFSPHSYIRVFYKIIFLTLASSFILGRILERNGFQKSAVYSFGQVLSGWQQCSISF